MLRFHPNYEMIDWIPSSSVIMSSQERLWTEARGNVQYFIQIVSEFLTATKLLLALQFVSISNDLYGSEKMSSLEIAKGFKKPIYPDTTKQSITFHIISSRDIILAKLKQTRILSSKATDDGLFRRIERSKKFHRWEHTCLATVGINFSTSVV